MSTERVLSAPAFGLRFAFRESGDPEAHPVILLHAMGPDGTDWDRVAERLAARFHVIALHQRGFGPATRTGDYTFERLRDDVIALADTLGLSTFSLVGHSMGGTVAYLVAQKVPERVARLVVEDTPPPWGGDMPDPPEEPPQPVPFEWEMWRGIARQLKYPDPRWWDELPDIECPVLIIGGGEKSHIPQGLLQRVASLIPNCRLVTIPAGHNVHAAKLEEFMAEVEGFLGG